MQPARVIHRRFSLSLFFFAFVVSSLKAHGAISIWTEPKQATVFAGENRSVRLFIKNSGEAVAKVKFETRFFQVATAAAPLGERKKWKEISLDGGQTVVEKFPLTLPEIRRTTAYLLKFYEEGRVEEAGSVSLVAYPEDLLSEGKERSPGLEFAVGLGRIPILGVDETVGGSRTGVGGRVDLAVSAYFHVGIVEDDRRATIMAGGVDALPNAHRAGGLHAGVGPPKSTAPKDIGPCAVGLFVTDEQAFRRPQDIAAFEA